jgi:hypothetical protein
MSYISSFLSQAQNNKVADMVIETTLANLTHRSNLLDSFCPFKTYTSTKFLSYIFDRINPVASVIAYGTEAPATRQGTFTPVAMELIKTGIQYVYDEKTMWDMKHAMEEANLKNIQVSDVVGPRGQYIQGSNNDLAKFLFGTIEQVARAQVELLDVLTWQVLQTGQINRTDPRTGVTLSMDYRNPHDTTYNHFPAALTGGARWDQLATANGIQDLFNAVDTFSDTNGFAPEKIVMSRKTYNNLLQQQSTKDAVSSATVTQVGTASPEQLDLVLDRRGIPPIIRFDEMFQNPLIDATVTKTRFLNDDRFVFLCENMGQRAMGPTLENDGQTGIYVVTKEIKSHPPVDATIGIASIIPVFADPKLLFSQQVK